MLREEFSYHLPTPGHKREEKHMQEELVTSKECWVTRKEEDKRDESTRQEGEEGEGVTCPISQPGVSGWQQRWRRSCLACLG